MHINQDGKPITTNLKDHTRLLLKGQYAEGGIENLESMEVLKVRPLTEFGSPV